MNPIKRIREDMGLTVREFSMVTGTSYATLHATEAGHPNRLPSSVINGLTRLGHDAEAVAGGYIEWREQQAQELLKAVQAN